MLEEIIFICLVLPLLQILVQSSTDFGAIMADENQNEVKDKVPEVSSSLLIIKTYNYICVCNSLLCSLPHSIKLTRRKRRL